MAPMVAPGGVQYATPTAPHASPQQIMTQNQRYPSYFGKGISIIGIQSGTATLTTIVDVGALTQTTFDVTTRADSAQIFMTNSSGASLDLRDIWIRAKCVLELAGTEGYIHDKFVDYDSISQNGDLTYELANEDIVTVAQINQLADLRWKENRMRRNLYTLTLAGLCSWFEPGEWYTLTIGTVGTSEYFSAVCECYESRGSAGAQELGTTNVCFRVMYANWTFDSNEFARSLASGKWGKAASQNQVIVGSSTYPHDGFLLCDGTADEVEINKAVGYLTAMGGGSLWLTPGTYNLAAAVVMASNVILITAPGTILRRNCNDYGITAVGSSGTHLENIMIVGGGKIICDDTNNKEAIRCDYVDKLTITDLTIEDAGKYGIYVAHSTLITISGNSIKDWNTADAVAAANIAGIYVDSSATGTIERNVLDCAGNTITNSSHYGIYVLSGSIGFICSRNTITHLYSDLRSDVAIYCAANESDVSNNIINDITCSNAGNAAIGILVGSNRNRFTANRVQACANSADSSLGWGFRISAGSDNHFESNYAYNNGDDAGTANTNACNFSDPGATSPIEHSNSWNP